MITYNELLSGHVINDLSIRQQQNLEELLKRLNVLRAAYGKPWTVNSGFRTEQDQRRIYSQPPYLKFGTNVPLGSAHLQGLAADISDRDGAIKAWLYSPIGAKLLEEQGLYCELDTVGWVHIQFRKPNSGNRWFKP
jgi:hypothetical protein